MSLSDFRRRKFAKFYDRVTGGYNKAMAEPKRELLKSLHGKVLELGPGTGANLPLLPGGLDWVGVERNEHMLPLLEAKANELGINVSTCTLKDGRIPLEDGSVDCVLSTLVLCSVGDLPGALADIRRVLKPGGHFVFWEHVLAPQGFFVRTFQHAFTPLQRMLADGCRCNVDFGKHLRGAGFADVKLEEFEAPAETSPIWVRAHVRGVATR